jgi:hypothetical protein
LRESAHQVKPVRVSKRSVHAAGRLDHEALTSRLAELSWERGGALRAHRWTLTCTASI